MTRERQKEKRKNKVKKQEGKREEGEEREILGKRKGLKKNEQRT